MIVLAYKSNLLMIFDRSIHSAHYIKTTDTAREPFGSLERSRRYAKKPNYQNLINEARAYHLRIKLYPDQPQRKKNHMINDLQLRKVNLDTIGDSILRRNGELII